VSRSQEVAALGLEADSDALFGARGTSIGRFLASDVSSSVTKSLAASDAMSSIGKLAASDAMSSIGKLAYLAMSPAFADLVGSYAFPEVTDSPRLLAAEHKSYLAAVEIVSFLGTCENSIHKLRFSQQDRQVR
jgi:hypothetical protein